jgi:hypothetical protein
MPSIPVFARAKESVLLGGVIGFVGLVGMAWFGTNEGSIPMPADVRWPWALPHALASVAWLGFWIATLLFVVGWLLIGRIAKRGGFALASSLGVLGAWSLPLLLGPPLFSRDPYSYVAQGLLSRVGLNPYVATPLQLHDPTLLASIAGPWRATPSPYGPLTMLVSQVVSPLAGDTFIRQVIVFRIPGLLGLIAMAFAVSHLAKITQVNIARALWLSVLSPLFLLSFVSTGHNDAIMIALLIAALVAMVAGRYLVAIGIAALAAACKLPALAATLVLATVEFRSRQARHWLRLSFAVVVTLCVIALTTLISGNGWGWASPQALKIPTELRTLITPSVCLGYFISWFVHLVRLPLSTHSIISVCQYFFELGIIVMTVILSWRATRQTMLAHLGMILLLLAILGPVIWPWYLTWGIAVLAVTSLQNSRVLATISCLAMFSVAANGIPILYGRSFFFTGPLVILGLAWFLRSSTFITMVRGDA